jgi:hypothetical protein
LLIAVQLLFWGLSTIVWVLIEQDHLRPAQTVENNGFGAADA